MSRVQPTFILIQVLWKFLMAGGRRPFFFLKEKETIFVHILSSQCSKGHILGSRSTSHISKLTYCFVG